MLTHQLSSKNLSPGEKIAMTEEFQKEVAIEDEKSVKKQKVDLLKKTALQLECRIQVTIEIEVILGQIRKQQKKLVWV